MAIKDEWTAFKFDEACLFLRDKATEKNGTRNWARIPFEDGSGNQAFIEFIKNSR